MPYYKDYPEQLKKCGCLKCKECSLVLMNYLKPNPPLINLADKMIISSLDRTINNLK